MAILLKIYNIESTQKALTILQIIIESLPDVVWIMSSKYKTHPFLLTYGDDDKRLCLSAFFDKEAETKENKTPLSLNQRHIFAMVFKYMKYIYQWELLCITGEKSGTIMFPECKNLFIESGLSVRVDM